MLRYLVCAGLLSLPMVSMAEEFVDTLKKAGVKQEVIDILAKNELTARDILCTTKASELKEIGVVLGQAKLIEKFCAADKPVELGDVGKLSELDLLKKLAENPDDANVLEALRGKSLVKKAEARTPSWAVVEVSEGGARKLDVQATFDYLKYVAGATEPPLLNKTAGKLIESVDTLGKAEGQFLLHPLFDGQCLIKSPDGFIDETRLNWSKVPQETMKALLWARTVGHENFVRLNLDANRVYAEVAKDTITDPFIKGILEDFQLAVKKKDKKATGIDLSATQADCKKKR